MFSHLFKTTVQLGRQHEWSILVFILFLMPCFIKRSFIDVRAVVLVGGLRNTFRSFSVAAQWPWLFALAVALPFLKRHTRSTARKCAKFFGFQPGTGISPTVFPSTYTSDLKIGHSGGRHWTLVCQLCFTRPCCVRLTASGYPMDRFICQQNGSLGKLFKDRLNLLLSSQTLLLHCGRKTLLLSRQRIY